MSVVSLATCERIVERDGRIVRHAVGWWRAIVDSRRYEGRTRPEVIRLAANDLQRRLEADFGTTKGGEA